MPVPKKNEQPKPENPADATPADPAKEKAVKKLANLRPHPQHLKKGRTPPELTEQEIEFCRYVGKGTAIIDAGRWVGFDRRHSYALMQQERIKAEIEKQRVRVREGAEARADKNMEDLRPFVVEDYK